MHMKTFLIVGLLGFGLASCVNAQKQADNDRINDGIPLVKNAVTGEQESDKAAFREKQQQDSAFTRVQHFYIKYLTEWIRKDGPDNEKLEAIQKQYVTRRFLDKLQSMYQDMKLDHDPFLDAQDCDKSVLDSLRIELDTARRGIYHVYLWDNFNRRYKKVTLSLKQDGNEYNIDDVSSL